MEDRRTTQTGTSTSRLIPRSKSTCGATAPGCTPRPLLAMSAIGCGGEAYGRTAVTPDTRRAPDARSRSCGCHRLPRPDRPGAACSARDAFGREDVHRVVQHGLRLRRVAGLELRRHGQVDDGEAVAAQQ